MKSNEDKTFFYKETTDKDGNIKTFYICPYFEVKRIIKKIPLNVDLEQAEIEANINGNKKIFCLNLEDVSDIQTVLKTFNKNYIFVSSANKYEIEEELRNQLNNVTNQKKFGYEHKCLGWQVIDDKHIFLLDRTSLQNGYFSDCIRATGKFTNGSEEKYDLMLKEEVFTNIAMTLAYVLGFCSVLRARIGENEGLCNLIVCLSGKSTTGKTTALNLIGSIWGDVSEMSGTVILRNNGSESGFQAQCSGLYGYPILWDDLFTNSTIKVDDFIYEKSKGTQKVVAKQNGDADFTRMGYSGIIIITSEDPILSKSSQKLGMYPRVIDFNEIAWTSSAENANKIKSCILKNYGFKAKPFVEYIQTISIDNLLILYKECIEIVKCKIKKQDSFTDRISQNYAIILLSIRLLSKCFNLNLDEDRIIDFALESEEQQALERNKAEDSYSFILSYFNGHKNEFDIYYKDEHCKPCFATVSPKIGKAIYKDSEINLYIPIDKVKKLLNDNNFTQIDNYKKVWKEKGYIKHENGRYDKSNSEMGRHFHFVYKLIEKGEI